MCSQNNLEIHQMDVKSKIDLSYSQSQDQRSNLPLDKPQNIVTHKIKTLNNPKIDSKIYALVKKPFNIF